MIEDEAKTKWCPFARVRGWDKNSVDFKDSYNRDNHDEGPVGMCLASACMVWTAHAPLAQTPGGGVQYVHWRDVEKRRAEGWIIDERPAGDCGLKRDISE